MIARVLKSFTSPAAGPTATLVAIAFAAVLGISWAQQARERAAFEARLGDLSKKANAASVYWKARYSACEASVGAQGPRDGALTKVAEGQSGDAMNRLSHEPAGFDVCARMEAADQAVLASLK